MVTPRSSLNVVLDSIILPSLFSALMAITPSCMEITQPGLPGSGVHK